MEEPALVNILLVDDQPGNLLALEAILGRLGQNLVRAGSGPEALKRLLEKEFALILLDVQMPGMDGLETAALIRQREKNRHSPIIFLTAHDRTDDQWLKGYSLGAVDFLFKPIIPEVLRAKVRVFAELEEKTEQIRRQAEELRESRQRDIEQQLAAERQRWEVERLRNEAAKERLHSEALRRSQEELSRLYEEIQQSNRRKDEFLAMLAHELRNPLAPLSNALHILRMGGCPSLNAEQARQMAERQVGHLARLVDDLLDVSRISRGKIVLSKEPTDLTAVVNRSVESTKLLIESRKHRLEVALPSGPLWLDADPLRIEQVLVNLLQNAAKYTKPGGSIRLSLEPETAAKEREGSDVPATACLRVRDTGVGIAPELLPSIFDLFVQADRSLDRSQGGLGIGLTLVKSLVELHGGSVQAFSAGLDQGSEFVVRLPLRPLPPPVLASPVSATDSLAPRRILVVDDNTDTAESMALLLQSAGHEVHTSYDGQAALENARNWRPEVVLLDIGLPRMDGYEVARRMRRDVHLQTALLIALSGYGQDEDRRRSQEAGFNAHLTKPIDLAELKALLAQQRDGA